MEITQELINTLFDYKDGVLYWKAKSSKCSVVKIGDIAGNVDPTNNRNRVRINGKNHLRSILIFILHHGYRPEIVDHIDRDKSNDRIENLRAADRFTNARNKTSAKNSHSKYLGVTLNPNKSWRAQIVVNKRHYYLGKFECEDTAALIYNREAVRHFGEFANLNIIQP